MGHPTTPCPADFSINPERIAPVLRRLVSPTKTRARIFDRDGGLILDSRNLYCRGDVMRFELPPPSTDKPGHLRSDRDAIRTWFNRGDLPIYRELGPENGKGYKKSLARSTAKARWCASTNVAKSSSRWRCRCSIFARSWRASAFNPG